MSSGDREYRRRRSRSHEDYHHRRRSRRSRSPKRAYGVSDGFMKEMARLQKDNQSGDLENRRKLEAVIGDAANVVGSFGKGGTGADILARQSNLNEADSESLKSESDGHNREDRSRSRRKRKKRKRRKFSTRGPDDQKWSRGRSISDSRSMSRKRRRRSRSRSKRRSHSRSRRRSHSRTKSRGYHSRSRRRRSFSRSSSRSSHRSRSRRTRRYRDPYVAQQKRDNAMLDYFQKQDKILPPTPTAAAPIKQTNKIPVVFQPETQTLVPPRTVTPLPPIIVKRPIPTSSKPIPVGTPIGLASLGPLIDTEKLCCLLCRRKFKSLEILKKHELKSDLHRKNIALKRDGVLPT